MAAVSKRLRRTLLLCVVGLAPLPALAQPADGWKVTGSVRVRYEVVDGQPRPGANASDELINLRSILLIERRSGPLRLGVEVYDSRIYGADRGTPIGTTEVNTLEPVQAYAALDLKSKTLGPVTLQAGRFTANIGSRRLIASDDYRNTINGYTGVRLDMAPGGIRTNLLYLQPQVRRPDGIDDLLDNRQKLDRNSRDLEIWGGVVAKPNAVAKAMVEAAYYHFEERDAAGSPTRDRSLDNLSARIIRDPKAGKWDFEVEAIRQTGQISVSTAPTAARQDVSAGFFHADLNYSFPGALRPRLGAEFDWIEGDHPGGKYSRFDTLFGNRRAELAPPGLYGAVGRANLITPGVRLELAPAEPWDGFIAARGLWIEAREDAFSTSGDRDPSGQSGRYAGFQVEGRWRYWLIKDRLRTEVDAAWLDKAGVLKTAPNAPRNGDEERYVSLNLTAQF